MSLNNPDINIAKNVRTIEWLKAELVTGLGSLFKAMVKNQEEVILDSLASLIMGCYFLGKRLGFAYNRIEEKIAQRLNSAALQEHEIEEWYGDVTNLQHHFIEHKRG